MFWNKYPYTDYSQINLDWLLRHIGGILRELAESAGFVPKITSSDHGKVLTAQNGKPVWTSGSAGGAFIVKVLLSDPSDEFSPLVLDKTWKEIKTATQNNAIVIDDSARNGGSNSFSSYGFLYSIASYPDEEHGYTVGLYLISEDAFELVIFSTNNENGYPVTGSINNEQR